MTSADMENQMKYQLLPGSEEENSHQYYSSKLAGVRKSKNVVIATSWIILVLSNLCTWLLTKHSIENDHLSLVDPRTPYANLERNVPIAMGDYNVYTDHNETLRDSMWEAINIDDGMVALSDDVVVEKGLPRAQRFPWDETKGIYLVNGYHNLHCVRAVYLSFMEFRQNKPQSRLWSHVVYCLDALRQDIICNADDIPRYLTADDNPESGVGQYRQCRDWNKLDTWVKQYNACYRYINQTETISELPNIERFIYCPEGSPYISQIEKFFGHVEW